MPSAFVGGQNDQPHRGEAVTDLPRRAQSPIDLNGWITDPVGIPCTRPSHPTGIWNTFGCVETRVPYCLRLGARLNQDAPNGVFRGGSIFYTHGFRVLMYVPTLSFRFGGLARIAGAMLLKSLDLPFQLKELSVSKGSAYGYNQRESNCVFTGSDGHNHTAMAQDWRIPGSGRNGPCGSAGTSRPHRDVPSRWSASR